jgi:hypothetical protein
MPRSPNVHLPQVCKPGVQLRVVCSASIAMSMTATSTLAVLERGEPCGQLPGGLVMECVPWRWSVECDHLNWPRRAWVFVANFGPAWVVNSGPTLGLIVTSLLSAWRSGMARSRVQLFEQIRRDWRAGEVSIWELAVRHHVHRRTVRQAVASAMPPPRKAYRQRPACAGSLYAGDRRVAG